MPRGIPVTLEQEAEATQLYLTGQTQEQVGEAVDLSQATVGNILKRKGIQARPRHTGSPRQHQVDDAYFEHVNTPDRAYWLGFLGADGCVLPKNNRVDVSLTAGDKGYLQKLLDCLDSDYLIHPAKGGTQSKISLVSAQLVFDLTRHAVTPRKSLTLKPPDFLPERLRSHFWRGVFDGDGTIFKSGGKWHVRWSGTKAMMEAVRGWCQTVSDTKARVHPHGSIYQFALCGSHLPLAVATALYQDSHDLIRLDRKYERYLQMLAEVSP